MQRERHTAAANQTAQSLIKQLHNPDDHLICMQCGADQMQDAGASDRVADNAPWAQCKYEGSEAGVEPIQSLTLDHKAFLN